MKNFFERILRKKEEVPKNGKGLSLPNNIVTEPLSQKIIKDPTDILRSQIKEEISVLKESLKEEGNNDLLLKLQLKEFELNILSKDKAWLQQELSRSKKYIKEFTSNRMLLEDAYKDELIQTIDEQGDTGIVEKYKLSTLFPGTIDSGDTFIIRVYKNGRVESVKLMGNNEVNLETYPSLSEARIALEKDPSIDADIRQGAVFSFEKQPVTKEELSESVREVFIKNKKELDFFIKVEEEKIKLLNTYINQ